MLPKSVYRYSALAFQPGAISVSQPAPTVLPTRVSLQLTAVVAVPTGEKAAGGGRGWRTEAPGIRKRSADFFERDAARHVQQTPGRDENAQTGADRGVPFLLDGAGELVGSQKVAAAYHALKYDNVDDDWFNDVSAFFQDQSPSMPNTVDPGYGPFPIIQR